MNDRKLFLAYFDVARYTRDEATRSWALDHVDTLLAKNQNGPEHGADGSFSEEEWTRCRAAYAALVELLLRAGAE